MRQLPVFFTVQDRPVLVVGGGAAAAAKVRLLLAAGARPRVVAPKLAAELAALAEQGVVDWQARGFAAPDVVGMTLVYGATGDETADRAVAAAARAVRVPVNVVDRADLSDFITPAIIDRDPITVAVSSGGAAPVLARAVKGDLEARLHPATGRLALFAERFRGAVKAVVPAGAARRRFWDRFFTGPVALRVLEGDEAGATDDMLALVNGRAARAEEAGIVHLVGGADGPADLLTLRAQGVLQRADVLVVDRAVSDGVLDLARREAERLAVDVDGIVALVRSGRRVVHLNAGEPDAGEAAVLRAAGIHVETVPGVGARTELEVAAAG